jgi:hypothetical protein
MRTNRFCSVAAGAALVAMLATSGCSKNKNQQASNQAATSAQSTPQPSGNGNPPPPPPDQSGPPPQSGASQSAAAQQSQTSPPPAAVVIPADTRVRVRIDQDLGSKISQAGETFSATIADPVVIDGQTVIPRDARAEGTVIDAQPPGHFRGGALLELRLERVRTQWGSYPVQTSTMERVEKGKGKRTGLFAGSGGAFGALVGGLAGGGKGALVGALAGAGAGTAGSAMTDNHEIFLPAETLITFRLERSVHVTEGQ